MRVLSIDPGYGRCGMAIVDSGENGRNIVIYSDCVETSSKIEFTERLAMIASECGRLIAQFSPDQMAIEKLFFNGNQKTAMRVAEVRGALIQCATTQGLQVTEYTPSQIKSAAGGWGGADKKQVITMVRMLVRIEKEIRHDDEYDAIAVGITHLALYRSNQLR